MIKLVVSQKNGKTRATVLF